MEQVLAFFEQAYVYVPTIMAVVSSVGIPSIVQLGRIIADVRYYLSQITMLFNKVNEVISTCQTIVNNTNQLLDLVVEQNELFASSTLNKKAKEQAVNLKTKILAIKEQNKFAIEKAVAEVKNIKKQGKQKVIKVKVKGGN